MPTAAELKENLRLLSTEQLVERRASGGLTEAAEILVDELLAERGVSAERKVEIAGQVKAEAARQSNRKAGLASLWQRFAGQFIDTIVALAFLGWGVTASKPGAHGAANLGALAFVGYLLLADGMPNGQSLGKRLFGTKVVDARTGSPCSFGQSAGRNILLMILGIIDWVFIFGPKRQRLGDLAANTLVLKVSADVQLGVRADAP